MSFLSSVVSLVGQPGVQAVAAGLLSGVVAGGALVASGALPIGGSRVTAATIPLTACPGAGPALAQVDDGASLLVTGRSADGRWFEVYLGEPGLDRAWAPADSLRFDTATDELPVADCSGPTPAPLPSPEPTSSPAATPTEEPTPTPSATPEPTATATAKATAKPTPKPTPKPTKTPKPAPSPTNQLPSVSNLAILNAYYDALNSRYVIGYQPCLPESATISVTATDPDGPVLGARLYYSSPGSGVVWQQDMTSGPGANEWRGVIASQGGWNAGYMTFSIRAYDNSGFGPYLNGPSTLLYFESFCSG